MGSSVDQVEILHYCQSEKVISELLAIAGRTNRTKFRDQLISPLIEAKLIEMIPDKPRSSKQKYRLTEEGKQSLAKREKSFLDHKIMVLSISA